MKIQILLLLLLSFHSIAETSFQVIGPCESTPIVEDILSGSDELKSVGDSTVDFLTKNDISFDGTREGIRSIEGLPTKELELIILSNEEILAYGWCYSVNGLSPEVYPHKFDLSEGDKVEWYFAFSRYLKGVWVSQCTPSYLHPRQEFCP